ncbi:MAG: hypothetical protein ACRELD_09835 [Longimicrobiales bacterium]
MDFVEATDRLTECPTHEDVASAVGVSINTIRQARLNRENAGYRPPPSTWEAAVARLARKRAQELQKLAEQLERQAQ